MKKLLIFMCIMVLGMLLGRVLYTQLGHRIVEAMYEGESVSFLNNIITGQAEFSVDYYFKIADKIFVGLNIFICVGVFFLLLIINQHTGLVWFISSVMGAVLVLLSTSRYGISLNPDSVAYISFARNLLLGKW